MAFPSTPTNKQIHIENGITFRFLTGLNRWELWNDSDATEANLDSEYHARREADSDIIYGRYHNFAVDKVESLINAAGPITINYNTGADTYTVTPGTSGWVWVPSASKLFIIQFGNISELKLVGSEPTEFTRIYTIFRKADTTGVSVDYQENGVSQQTVNASNYIFITPTFQGTYPNIRGSIDSELNLREHLSQTAESLKLMSLLYNHNDSEMYKKLDDTNLDLDSEIHDRKAGDSDIHDLLDSEYRHRKDVDSDLRYALDSEIHDRKAADSDFNDVYSLQIVRQKIDIPSVADFVRVDTAWNFLNTANNTSGWYTHNDGVGTQRTYIVINGRLITQYVGTAAEVTVNNRTYRRELVHFAQRVLERNGVGQSIQALVYNFHVERLDKLDFEMVIDSETDRAGLDSDIKNNFVEIIKSFRLLDSEVGILQRFDSDLNLRFDDLDSENKRMHDSDIHDRKAGDSDLRYALDSEIHDRKAADSDIYAYFEIDLDSERHDWKAGDSDIRNRKATSAYMMEDVVFIPKTQLTGGSVQFLTDGTVINQVNIRSEFGSAWFTFASSIFTGLLNDTNVIIVDDEVVGVFADPGFATTEYTVGNKTYSRLAQTGIVVQISGPGNPATNSNPYGVGVNYDDQLEYTNRKELKTPEDFDSDTTRNFDLIAVALSRLDSEIKFVADDLVKNYVAYDSDSEIEAAALRLTGDENVGRIFWDDDDKTVAATLNSNVTLQIGQEFHFFAKATEDITNGDLVMFDGAQGDHLLMKKADHSTVGFLPEHIMGVATSDVTNNQFGYVTQIGKVRGLDTSAFAEGALLYSDPDINGRLLDSEPTYPSHSILVAAVTRSHATEGSIYVRVSHKRDLDELHGVLITDPPEGTKHNQVVAWDSDSTLWRNISINTDFGDF